MLLGVHGIHVSQMACVVVSYKTDMVCYNDVMKNKLKATEYMYSCVIASQELVEYLVVLVRQVRTQHVTRKDDLPKHLLNVDYLEQAHLVLGCGSPRACSEPMCAMEVAISNCPEDASGRKEVRHLHIRLKRLSNRKELDTNLSVMSRLRIRDMTLTHSSSPSSPLPTFHLSAFFVTLEYPSSLLASEFSAAHSQAAPLVKSRTLPRERRDTISWPYTNDTIRPDAAALALKRGETTQGGAKQYADTRRLTGRPDARWVRRVSGDAHIYRIHVISTRVIWAARDLLVQEVLRHRHPDYGHRGRALDEY